MKRYDRTWPTAVAAIAFGSLLGSVFIARASHTEQATFTRVEAAPSVEAEIRTRAERTGETFIRELEGHRVIVSPNPSAEPLLDQLRYSDSELERMNAAVVLGSLHDAPNVRSALMIAVGTDPYAPVRIKAAEALGRLGGEVVVGSLSAAATTDSEPEVREMAARSLGKVANQLATETLVKALFTDRSADVRVQAALSLGLVGSKDAVGALVSAERSDESEAVRRAAYQALGVIELQGR